MSEIKLAATVENIPLATAFLDEELEKLDCPMKAQMQIAVAVDELMSNIARYAYTPGTGDVTVRLDFDPGTRMAEITFLDSGVPYDPLQKADPDVTLAADERAVGGLGIFLVKKTMDALRYRYADGMNQLTICKKI